MVIFFLADAITTQVKATELVAFFSLEKSAKEWAEEFERHVRDRKAEGEVWVELSKTNYDVTYQVKCYEQFYLTGDITKLKK